MNKSSLKKSILLASIIILMFVGAGFIFYLFIFYFPTSGKFDYNGSELDLNFTTNMYPQLLDLGKFFLTVLIGIFVASITFSEKIINFNSTSWWAKSLLILCWILLLISIVSDGVGLVFLTNWYAVELIKHAQFHVKLFTQSFICFGLAGISFGLALTSMLSAGLISFLNNTDLTTTIKQSHRYPGKAVKKWNNNK
jgi:hypothetical protein